MWLAIEATRMMEPHLVLLRIICLAAYWAVWYTPGRVLGVVWGSDRRGRRGGKEKERKKKRENIPFTLTSINF